MTCQILRRFSRDKRALELDYMLSLFIFILSLGFTFIVLTQYLDAKHAEVTDVNERLISLRILDDLTGSPGWMGRRSDWEVLASKVDLEEKVNDQSFIVGLRKNDRFFGYNIIVPGSGDSLMQTASESTITTVIEALRDQCLICVEIATVFRPVFWINTSVANSSIAISGSADNATTHVGSFFVGADLDVWVTDMRNDSLLHYDTVVIGNNTLNENSVVSLAGRNFTVYRIDQERVLLYGQVSGGFVMPDLDYYHYDLARGQLAAAGVKFGLYEEIVSGCSASLEYTLFSRPTDKFEGQVTDLSIKKIRVLEADVPYEVAKSSLGIRLDFHIGITRNRDSSVVLEYGLLAPWDTERVEREVDVEGVPCTFVLEVW